jgi:hypothetical protein
VSHGTEAGNSRFDLHEDSQVDLFHEIDQQSDEMKENMR